MPAVSLAFVGSSKCRHDCRQPAEAGATGRCSVEWTGYPLRILTLAEIRPLLNYPDIIDRMREALLADAVTPMPMHLDIPMREAEVHMKSSYRLGGKYFALKVASTFPQNRTRGLSTGNGMM